MSGELKILILAAGKGRRMGGTKQLLPYLNKTLLGSVVELSESLQLGRPVVVLGHDADRIKASLEKKELDIIVNPNWSQGMGNTLAYAVKTIYSINPKLQKVLVLLADQPKISRSHLLHLLQENNRNKSPIIATSYPNGGGVPAVFDRSVFPALMKLDGDKGARQIIRDHKDALLVPPAENEVWDIDTPEDYQKLLGEQ